jgi:hypothetical protein
MAAGLGPLATMPDWLAGLDDGARVRSALAEAVPGLLDARLEGVRLKPETWSARVTLTVAGETQHLAATIVPPGQDAPAADGWRWVPALRLALVPAPPETKLPALELLTDPERAGPFLERAIRAGSPAYPDLRILGCEARVMRYTPGSRCTVLYRLELPKEGAGGWPDVVVAKTYHRPDKGRIAWEAMRALWRSPLRGGGVVAIAEPLAWVPERTVLVQGPVRQEQTLKDLLLATLAGGDEAGWRRLRRALAMAAAGLVELHRSGAPSARRVTWDDELAGAREVLGRLTARLPELAGAADGFLDRVQRLAEAVPPDPGVPSHRSFRPAQVLLHQDAIGFIDFDGFCQAEPALDLALFRATVRDLGMSTLAPGAGEEATRALLATLDGLCDDFLASYRRLAPVSVERVAAWEALDLFTNVLHSWTKANPVRLGQAVGLLEHHGP